jgi:hypothetical protein
MAAVVAVPDNPPARRVADQRFAAVDIAVDIEVIHDELNRLGEGHCSMTRPSSPGWTLA